MSTPSLFYWIDQFAKEQLKAPGKRAPSQTADEDTRQGVARKIRSAVKHVKIDNVHYFYAVSKELIVTYIRIMKEPLAKEQSCTRPMISKALIPLSQDDIDTLRLKGFFVGKSYRLPEGF